MGAGQGRDMIGMLDGLENDSPYLVFRNVFQPSTFRIVCSENHLQCGHE